MSRRTVHRILLVLVLAVSLVAAATGATPSSGAFASPARQSAMWSTVAPPDGLGYEPGELLIRFDPSLPPSGLQATRVRADAAQLLGQDAQRLDGIQALGVERWQVPEGEEMALAAALNATSGVAYAEPNYRVFAHLTPDDPRYNEQWAHPVIDSPLAWDLTTGSGLVTVAVIDTGVDLDNPEFQGRLTAGYDYANNDAIPDDDHGHGTHVAGIIAAEGNNHVGVAGMGWQTLIMPIKALDGSGSGTDLETAAGIVYAVDNGADIINLSLGGVGSTQTLYNAVAYAHGSGVLVIASAGNCGGSNYAQNGCSYQDQPSYPAAYDAEVVAVAATTPFDTAASFSNRGSYVDIAAPGSSILSTVPGSGYYAASGTSQAAPHVAGLASLIVALNPALTPQEIQARIEAGAVDLGDPAWDPDFGAGRIDADAALEASITLAAPTLPAIENADHDGDYLVDWSDVGFATAYTLEEDDNAGFGSPETAYSGPNSQVAVTGQGVGTWYYRVRATRNSLSSDWSAMQSVQVGLDAPVLDPISNGGSDTYTVTWGAVADATTYRLQEAGSPDFAGASELYLGPDLGFGVVNRDGGAWYYRVQASDGVVVSPWSVTQPAVVLPDAPVLYPVVGLAAPDAYTMTWSSSTGATGYRLAEAPTPTFTNVITRYVGAGQTYTVTGQRAGTWFYRVAAGNAAGLSAPSNVQSTTVTVPAIPIPQLNPIAAPGVTPAYTVTWSPVLTATAYILEESSSPWFEAPELAYTGTLTRYLAVDQLPATWHYRVRAVTPTGPGPWSNARSVAVAAHVFLPLVMR